MLDIVEEERPDRALRRRSARHAHERFHEMAERYEVIGDVRGPGLFIGVDLVVDRETTEPATEACTEALDHALDHGLITYFGGAGQRAQVQAAGDHERRGHRDDARPLRGDHRVRRAWCRGRPHRRAARSSGCRDLSRRRTMSSDNEGISSRERRDTIKEMLLAQDSVTVRDLAERFDVSAMTIHRDLDALEAIGVLRKVRGGATAQPTALYESSLGFRLAQMPDAKREIAGRRPSGSSRAPASRSTTRPRRSPCCRSSPRSAT